MQVLLRRGLRGTAFRVLQDTSRLSPLSSNSPLDLRVPTARRFQSALPVPASTVDHARPGEIQKKLILGFTCKKCDTRQFKPISSFAYQNSVVIVRCDHCKNLHLIADHLRWFSDKSTTVESLMKDRGEEVRRVMAEWEKKDVESVLEFLHSKHQASG